MTVLVAGGRGFMGKRIIRLLHETLPDVEVLTAGRSAENDRQLDVKSPSAEAMRGATVVINTVGAFSYDPAPLVNAAHEAGAHYVDIAERASFVAAARIKHPVLAAVSGASTVPGLIEVLAEHWAGQPPARVRAQLSIGTNNPASATLLYSMLEPIGRHPDPEAAMDDRRFFLRTWARKHHGVGKRRYGRYPGVYGDALQVGESEVPTEFGFGFDRRVYTRLLQLNAPILALLPRALLRLQATIGAVLAPLARPLGTRIGILSLDALDERGEVTDSIEVRASKNGLDVPARPAVWAAEALLKSPRPTRRLSELVTADTAAARLREAGYKVTGL
ncbi:MAG: saccharopine dehydrogenase NADP-binding domain-containing protein [Planctomycetes bacterium]|nr:saccharopine dehydrogenase NADP-binding domain-containing protein [Planctomycetota bacterium]